MSDISKFNLLPDHIEKINGKKIVYIASDDCSGYSWAAKGYIYNLIRNNAVVKFFSYTTSSKQNNDVEFSKLIKDTKNIIISSPDEIIIHSIPEGWDVLLKNLQIKYTKNTKIIGRTVWEFEKLHPTWVNTINDSIVTHVSVPTEWNKTAFLNSGVKKPIIVDPHICIDAENKNIKIEDILKKSVVLTSSKNKLLDFKYYYKFYCIEQFIDRKNLKAIIDSYFSAFTADDKVILFLKTYRKDHSIQEQLACASFLNTISSQKYPNHAPIVYIKEELTYDEIQSLHDTCDCYLNLSHTEGFGLSIHTAHKKEKDIIATGYGGHIEYLNNTKANLVKFKMIPVNSHITENCYLDETYSWADPDKECTIELMRNLYKKGIESEKYYVSNFLLKNNSISITNQKQDVKFVNLPYNQNNFYFNSSLFNLNNNLYLMARHCNINEFQIANNTLKLFKFNNQNNSINELKLKIKDEVINEQYEDPRVLIHDDKIYVGCANYQSNKSKYIHQKILIFDSNFNHIDNIHPIYEGNEKDCLSNTQHQKNWTYFIHNKKMLCVYKMYPHTIVEFDLSTNLPVVEYKTYTDLTKNWKFGEPRMGSNPILKDGIYHNFFHSSLPWKNPKRQYFMGYYTFEANPPFKIINISKEPIIWGNETDFRYLPNFNPIVVFPCGAFYENNNFYVSFGFNDEKTGIIKI